MVVTVVVVLVLAGYWAVLGSPASASSTPTPGSVDGGLVASGTVAPGCNPTNGVALPDRTALLIPNYNPAANESVGDHVNVTFEINATAATVPVAGLNVYTPTIFITMPAVGGASFTVTFSDHNFTLTGAPWTSLSFDKLVTSNVTFDPAVNATLSTQKIGTMADTSYGTLLMEWRWSWNLSSPNGSYLQGPWTVPTSTLNQNVWLPSIFKPAPYVDLLSESPTDDSFTSNYTMNLGGDVAGRSFYFELETAAIGTIVATKWVTDGAHTNKTFSAKFPLGGSDGYPYPGKYLVHIHDSCGALLYSKSVVLTYPPAAAVQITVLVQKLVGANGWTLGGLSAN